MVDLTDPRALKRDIEQEAYGHYERLSGTTLARDGEGRIRPQGHNDALDAFRHAYTSGRVTQLALGIQAVSRHFGDDNEIGPAHPNDPFEHRMDLWNNEVGRRLGDATRSGDALAQRAYAAIGDGTLVTGLHDPRLRALFPDDPRLQRPAGDPQRDLLTRDDVDRINRDVGRALDAREQRAQLDPRDRAIFDALRGQLPAHVPDDKVAEAMLRTRQAGIDRAEDIDRVAVQGDRALIVGRTPGFRAQVDLDTPAPPMRDTVYDARQHAAQEAYAEQRRQPAPSHAR